MKMMFNKFQKLQNLQPDKTEWKVRVRAQSIWEGVNRTTNEFKGLNVIFIDDSSTRIHAFLNAKICDFFKEDLKEGNIYRISNFHVKKYDGEEKNRAIRNEKHIYFDNYTKLVTEKTNLTFFPTHAFDLFDLEDAAKFVTDPRFLIDVVGMIRNKYVERVYSKEDDTKSHIRFIITDGSCELRVTFFNKLAEQLEEQLKQTTEEQVMIIIASAKVNEHDGSTCLNNYPATRFYLNPNHYSVKIMKKRLAGVPVNPKPDIVEEKYIEEVIDDKIYKISDIKKFTAECIQKKYKCQVIVKKVEEKTNWYDNVCTSCAEEVNIVQGRYKCENCKRNIPFPDKRFRLATVCNDSSGCIGIVFPDEEIQRITGKNVFDIENDDSQVGDSITFPPLLKAFEKKEFIVTLMIGETNVHSSCNVYIAHSIDEPPEMLGDHVPGEVTSAASKQDSISMNLEETLNRPTDSPATEKSTNKQRARKKSEAVPFEAEEILTRRKTMKKDIE